MARFWARAKKVSLMLISMVRLSFMPRFLAIESILGTLPLISTIYKHLQKPNTAGYDIKYYKACAWRRSIWGNIQRDLGDRFEPVRDSLEFEVKRNNQLVGTISTQSDDEGNFRVDIPFELYKGDLIQVIKVGGRGLNTAAVFPTLPFTQVKIEYADFFNDVAIGQVSAAKVKNWDIGEWEEIINNRNIQFNNGAITTCDNEGNFSLSYDFKPGENVVASIDFNGFKVDSPSSRLTWRF